MLQSRGELITLGGTVLRLERKMAGVLLYLAVEGPTARTRLAGLLWPESAESTARNNLRQVLHRLRQLVAPDASPIEGDAELHLRADVDVQVHTDLLAGHEYDDCADFADWLASTRERVRREQAARLRAEVQRLEALGAWPEAWQVNEELLELDPVSEQAHRDAMRLLYVQGDRAAALNAYHRCQDVLRRTLGVAPLPETQDLALTITRASDGPPSGVRLRPVLPVSLHRPPTLIGRAGDWAALERAWAAGQHLCVVGVAGVGKTRLVTDFAASLGTSVVVPARSGDAGVPHATLTRGCRALLRSFPHLELTSEVRAELARLIPELGATPGPLAGEAEPRRFHEALLSFMAQLAGAGLALLVWDDLHHADAASLEVLALLLGTPPREGSVSVACTVRPGALPEAFEGLLAELVASGAVGRHDLQPLAPADARALVLSLDVVDVQPHAELIARRTGGSPLFILEAVRHVVDGGELQEVPARVAQVIQARLARLSAPALDLARVAAVAGTDLSAELAGEVLGTSPLALTGAWRELEAAQVLDGLTFTHDLLRETVTEAIPASVRGMLHRRTAAHLEAGGVAARVAHHWWAGGVAEAAGRWYTVAATAARDQLRLEDAAALFRAASQAFQAAGQRDEAFEALRGALEVRLRYDVGADTEAALGELARLAGRAAQRVRHLTLRAKVRYAQQRYDEAVSAALEGLAQVTPSTPSEALADLHASLANAELQRGRYAQAADAYERALVVAREAGNADEEAALLGCVGTLRIHLAQHRQAVDMLRAASAALARTGNRLERVRTMINLGVALAELGQVRDAIGTFTDALDELQATGETHTMETVERVELLSHLNAALLRAGRPDEAWNAITLAVDGARAQGLPDAHLRRRLAQTLLRFGRLEDAERAWRDAAHHAAPQRSHQIPMLMLEAQLALARGTVGDALRARVAHAAREEHDIVVRTRLLVLLGRLLGPAGGAEVLREALTLARAHDLNGLVVDALTLLAGVALARDEAQRAVTLAAEAAALLGDHEGDNIDRAEVLGQLGLALHAAGRSGGEAHLEEARRWRAAVAARSPQFLSLRLNDGP